MLEFKPRQGSRRNRGPRGSEGEEREPCGFGGEGRGSRRFGRVNRRGPCGFGEEREDHSVLGCSFLPRSLGSRRDFARKKRGERTLVLGP